MQGCAPVFASIQVDKRSWGSMKNQEVCLFRYLEHFKSNHNLQIEIQFKKIFVTWEKLNLFYYVSIVVVSAMKAVNKWISSWKCF